MKGNTNNMHTFDNLKPRQQQYIVQFFEGLLNEHKENGSSGVPDQPDIEIHAEYTRSFLRYMSSKYCDMEWAPAWIVKDKSRQTGVGIYTLPEVVEYANSVFAKQDELPADDGETIIVGTQVVSA